MPCQQRQEALGKPALLALQVLSTWLVRQADLQQIWCMCNCTSCCLITTVAQSCPVLPASLLLMHGLLHRPLLVISVMMMAFQQFTGINAVRSPALWLSAFSVQYDYASYPKPSGL